MCRSWRRQSAASLLPAHPRLPPSKTLPSAAHPCTHRVTASLPQPSSPCFWGTGFLASAELLPQLNYQGSSSYPFAWAAGNSPPLPSHPVLWTLQCLWNSLHSEKRHWKRSFGQNVPQSNRGQWQTQRHWDQLRLTFLRTSQNAWKRPMQENNKTYKSWNSTPNTNTNLTPTGLYWILGDDVHTAATAQCSTTLLYFALICCNNWYRREERELILPAGLNELYLTSILL